MIPHTEAEHVAGLPFPYIDTWGPFSPDIDTAERNARLRSLRTVVHIVMGPRCEPLSALLSMAEVDPSWLLDANHELNALPTRDRRRVLASYGSVACPRWNG